MVELIPNLLRSLVTTVMSALLLIVLGQPKYGRRSMYFIVLGVFLSDMIISVLFYLYGDLTTLARVDIVLYVVLGIVLKPFFKDKVMQWVFNCITSMNVFAAVLCLSFWFSRPLSFPEYFNSVLRFILFGAAILLFRRLRPLYRRVSSRWPLFVLSAFAILVNYVYYIAGSDDIIVTLSTQAAPLALLTALAAAVYVTIFYSLQKVGSEYALRRAYLEMQNRQDIMSLSMNSMGQRLRLMDELEQQSNMARHDRRHFNNTLLELLKAGSTEEAVQILEGQSMLKAPVLKHFCENTTVDAAVSYYAGLARERAVELDFVLDIPEAVTIDSLELAIVLSNLLENAVNAAGQVPEATIRFTCVYTGQLLVEMENPYSGHITVDERGHPVTDVKGHGVGTKSVVAFAEKYGALIEYEIKEDRFKVRLVI